MKSKLQIIIFVFSGAILMICSLFLYYQKYHNVNISESSDSTTVLAAHEIISVRTPTSKTYDLGNGNLKKIIHPTPIHYLDDANTYQDINTSIQVSAKEGFGYEVTEGIHKAYFADYFSNDTTVRMNIDDLTIDVQAKELGVRDIEGNMISVVSEPQRVPATINNNSILYPNAYGEGIDVDVTYGRTSLKRELVLDSFDVLNLDRELDSTYLDLGFNFTLEIPETIELQIDDTLWDGGALMTSSTIYFVDKKSGETIFYFWPPLVHDATGDISSLTFSIEKNDDGKIVVTKLIPIDWLKQAQYPVRADDVASMYPSADTYFYDYDADYTTAQQSTWADYDYPSSQYIRTGQYYDETWYVVLRSVLAFDSSALGANASISSANLKLHGYSDGSVTDFDISVVQWTGADDFPRSNFTEFGTSVYAATNTASFTELGYNILDFTDTSIISKTGTTTLGLRSGRDISVTTPSGFEQVFMYSSDEAGTDKDPILEITYTSAVSWTGAAGDWCTGSNWSGGSIPTAADTVAIDIAGTITTSGCANGQVQFNNLTIGGTTATVFKPSTTFGTAGSVTVASSGVFEQSTTSQLVISGTLTIASGGVVTHTANVSSQIYEIDISATDVNVQDGGSINANEKGHASAALRTNGTGNGAGLYGGTSGDGGGGAHGGNGGNGNINGVGGTGGYDSVTNPVLVGSSGGGGYDTGATSGSGGGAVILSLSGTLTVATGGSITADGGNGVNSTNDDLGGGGAGGSVNITANTITLNSGSSITADGGDGGYETDAAIYQGGAGGGGMIAYNYATLNNSGVTMTAYGGHGGNASSNTTGSQYGGAGTIYANNTSTGSTSLTVTNNLNLSASTVSAADSDQNAASYSVTDLTIADGANYVLPSGASLTATNSFGSSTYATSLVIESGGTYSGPSSLSIPANLNMIVADGATVSGITTLTIDDGGILTFDNYLGADTAFSQIANYVVNGTMTHSANVVGTTVSSNAELLKVSATAITVGSTGSINANEKGHASAALRVNGTGDGAGLYGGTSGNGGGGGHGGNGGDGYINGVGGTGGYDSVTNPVLVGSSGGGGYDTGATSGSGGGAVILSLSGTLTVATGGSITADGGNGVNSTNDDLGGGGAGGSVNITANTITLNSGSSITADGGDGGYETDAAIYQGGAGGGGMIAYNYATLNNSGVTMTAYGGHGGNASTNTTGSQYGGAGTIYANNTSTGSTSLTVTNNLDLSASTVSAAESDQNAASYSVTDLTIADGANYVLPSGASLTATNSFGSSTYATSLVIESGGTYSGPSSLSIPANLNMIVADGATVSGITTLTIDDDGILTFDNYLAADTAFSQIANYVVNGTMTHSANVVGTTVSSNAELLKVSATAITVGSTGSINANGKGHASAALRVNGTGDGAGLYGGTSGDGGGGGHGGNGGNGYTNGTGGTAYDSITNPVLVGSSGGGGYDSVAISGSGGGAVILSLSGTLTVATGGSITADGGNGADSTTSNLGGGGAGGSVNITANTITLNSGSSITADGGDGGYETDAAIYQGGGGGGGLVYFSYITLNNDSSVTATGGTGGNNGSDGVVTLVERVPTAPTSLYSEDSDASAGSSNPTDLTSLTPVFSALCNTSDGQCTLAEVEVADNAEFTSPDWQSGQINIADTDDSVRIGDITYAGSQLNYSTTYYWRIKFHSANGAGAWSTETATFYVPRAIELYTFNYGGAVQSGESVDIIWGSSGGESGETVKIEYSTNDFSSATTIVASTSSLPATSTPNTYLWTIPDATTVCGASSCDTVKIRISSNNDGNVYNATSEQAFTIQDSAATGIKFGHTFVSEDFYTVSSTSGFLTSGSFSITGGPQPKKKTITVTNSVASELTNYQVRVPITYDADMQADFDDIRFYASDDATELDFWIESKTDSGSAVFWVEIPTIPSSSSVTISMFYGNSGLSSGSNINNTFVVGDNFDGATLDAEWTERTVGGASVGTFSGGAWTKTCNGECDWWSTSDLDAAAYVSDPGGTWEAVTYMSAASGPTNSNEGMMLYQGVRDGWIWARGPASSAYYSTLTGGSSVCSVATTEVPTYLKIQKITDNGSGVNNNYTFWRSADGSTWVQCGTYTATDIMSSVGLMIKDWATGETSATYDFFYIKKYASSEPTVEIGSETSYVSDIDVTDLVGHTFSTLSTFSALTTGSGTVKFQISDDGGTTWYYCVGDTLTGATYSISQANSAAELTDACLAEMSPGTFKMRSFLNVSAGQTAVLDSYSYLLSTAVPNTAPTVSIGTASQTSAGIVTVTSTISDSEDNTSLTVQYSLDGSSWASTTLGGVDVDYGAVTTSSGQILGIDSATTSSVNLTIEWNIAADLSEVDDSTVYLRLIPNDGTIDGDTVSSTAFAVDTLDPTAPGDLSIYAITSSTIQLTFPTTNASDTNFSEYKIYYASSSPVSESSSVFTSSTDVNLSDLDFNAATQSVAFSGFSASTTYYFKLYAYDDWGNSTSSAEISTTTLPSAPTVPAITTFENVTSSTLTINWQDNSSGNNQETGFMVRYGTSIGDYSVGSSSVDPDITTANISSLTASTTYYFVVEATNSGGTSTSSYSSTTTLKGVPAEPIGLTFSSVSTTTLTISWTDASSGSPTSAAETFTIKYNTDGSETYGSTAGSTNSGTNTLDVTLSTPNSAYYFVVIATNNGGTSTSSQASTTTDANIPTSASASAVSTSSISVSWNANSNPVGTVYQVYNVTNSSVVATTTDTSLTVSSLDPNVAYTFKVRAENLGADGTYSDYSNTTDSVHTLASPPGQPEASNPSTSTIDIAIDTNGNSASTTYAIYNETSGNYIAANGTSSGSEVFQESTTWGTVTARGLSLDTSYQFSVIAQNGDGVNSATSTASTAVYTLVNPAGTPTVNTPTVSSLNITLDTNSNPISAKYAIYNETSGNYIDSAGAATSTAVFLQNATWGTKTLVGLSKNVGYQFSVIAQNSAEVNAATSTLSAQIYTKAAKPLNPTVDNPLPNSLDVTIAGSENGNSSSTEYAIYSVTFDAYIDALGATTTNPVWQTTSTWGTVTVNGLTENTSYSFKIKAKNGTNDGLLDGLDEETLLSDPTAAYTGVGDPDNFQAIIISTSTITFSVSSFANDDQPTSGYCFYQTTCAEGSDWIGTNGWEATGLTANTQYSFYVKYRNGDGVESNTTTLQLYTAATPPGAPTITALSPSSFSIEMDINGNPADTTYSLYNVTSDTYYNSSGALSATPLYYTSSTWASVTLGTGFSVNTQYTFQAYAKNGNNIVSDASATSSAYTYSATPAVPSVSSITSSSLQLTLGADTNPIITEYAIRIASSTSAYVQANGSIDASEVWQAASVWGTVSVSGLSASTSYTFDVKAKNGPADTTLDGEDTETDFGTSVTTTTLKVPPSATTDLAITDLTDATLTISWTDNSNGTNNEEDSFVVRYGLISETYASSTSVGNDVTSTSITGLTPNRAYYFVVEATNNGGTSTSSPELSTTTLRAVPTSPTFVEFTDVTSSSIKINWTNNTTADNLEDSFVIVYGMSAGVYSATTTAVQGATSSTISGLSVNTTYYIQVKAINVSGEAAMAEQSQATLMRTPDAPANLLFSSVTNDAITVSWDDNGSALDNDEEDSVTLSYGTTSGIYTSSSVLAANATSTTVSGLNGNDEYFFVVEATNGSGTSISSQYSTTTLHDTPAAPSTPTFSSITSSTFSINWANNTTDADRESSLIVYYGTSTSTWSASSTLAVGETTLAVTGLDASTTYFAKVQAVNETGSSESDVSSTSTLSAIPSAPTTIAFSQVASSSLHISWTDTTSGSSAATSFRISYGILTQDYSQGSTTVVAPTTSTTVTGLLANQVYYFVVTAINNGGEATSTESTVITLREVSPAPTISSISNKSSSGFTVNWADNSSSNRDNEQSFVVRYGIVENEYSEGTTTTVADATSAVISGLSPNTTYYLVVEAVNNGGTSTSTATSTITLANTPGAPTFGSFTGVSCSEISLDWTNNTTSSTLEDNVIVYYGFADDEYTASSTLAQGSTTTTVTGLTAGTAYYFQISAVNGTGEASTSETITTTTLYCTPDAPTNVNFSSITSESVVISWDDNGSVGDGDQESSYRVRYGTSSGVYTASSSVAVDSVNTTILGLNPLTEYFFVVDAINGSGTGTSAESSTSTIVGSPTAPDITSFSGVGTDVFTVYWTDNSSSENQEDTFYVYWGISGDAITSGPIDAGQDATSTQITGLTANQQYYVTVVASNTNGNSTSTPDTTTTLPVAPAAPTMGSPTGVTSSSITVNWTNNTGETDTASSIAVIYGTSTLSYTATSTASFDATSKAITGLDPNQEYYFKVVAINVSGQAQSDEGSAITLKVTPPQASYLILSGVNATSANLLWTDNAELMINEEESIMVAWGTALGNYTTGSSTLDVDVTSTTISGLTPNQTYYFVVTYTNNGGSSTSDSVSTTTIRNASAAPSFASFTNVSTSGFTINWSNNTTNADIEDSFVINYGTSTMTYTASTTAVAGATSKAISGLSANTTYYVQVVAVNTSGQGEMSEQFQATSAESSNSGSGSQSQPSSGGGSSAPPPAPPAPPTNKPEEEVKKEVTRGYGQPVSVTVKGKQHTVVVSNIADDGRTTIQIFSEPKTVVLYPSGESLVDVDEDGTPDLYMKLKSADATLRTASLQIVTLADLEFAINNHLTETNNRFVVLNFNSPQADQIAVSNKPNFANASFEPYVKTRQWLLSEGDGKKTVYVKLRTKDGGEKVLTASITLKTTGTPTTEPTISCPLTIGKAYKSGNSPAVYYVTKPFSPIQTTCTKRAFNSSDVFFTYFDSWKEVASVSEQTLLTIPNDQLGFMPWGPKFDPKYGALVKTVNDPAVYLLLGTEKYWITSEDVFTALGYQWNWIEDVDERVLENYTLGSEISYTDHHPNYTLVKYPNSPKVYRLEPNKYDATKQVKRHIENEKAFLSLGYRWDRIVEIGMGEVYEEGDGLSLSQ